MENLPAKGIITGLDANAEIKFEVIATVGRGSTCKVKHVKVISTSQQPGSLQIG